MIGVLAVVMVKLLVLHVGHAMGVFLRTDLLVVNRLNCGVVVVLVDFAVYRLLRYQSLIGTFSLQGFLLTYSPHDEKVGPSLAGPQEQCSRGRSVESQQIPEISDKYAFILCHDVQTWTQNAKLQLLLCPC